MIRMGSPFLLVTALFFVIGLTPSSADDSYKQICPEGCHCSTEEYYITLHCTSFSFIKKLSPKELSSIESLDISNSSLKSLDKHLVKKLVNLERLNLSNNRLTDIKHFPFLSKLTHLNLRSNLIKTLPGKQLGSLEVLDISHNYIRELPAELPKWTKLKRIYVGGNTFTCSRESLDTRDALVDKKVKLIGNPICSTPSKFYGKSWVHAVDFDEYIKLHNQDDVLADEPEGSGDVQGSGDISLWTTVATPEEENRDSDFNFGSGDSDYEENREITDHTDHDDYTTELYTEGTPIEEDEGSGNIDEERDDIFSTTEIIITEPIISTKKSIDLHTVEKPTTELTDKVDTVTEGPDDNINEELGNVEANKSDKASLGVNIFLVIMFIALVAAIVYLIKKRKDNKRRRGRRKPEDLEKQNAGTELLPKSPVVNDKHNGNAETAPLMNGQNGDLEKEIEKDTIDNVNKTPVEIRKKDVANGDSRDSVESPNQSSPSRSPKQDVLSVKVKASEIPDSIPSKPILVDRRKTSDGQNIVVTPNLNQRASPGD